MNHYWAVTKDGKYYSNHSWTTNINMAYVYTLEEEAQRVATFEQGEVIRIK